MFAIEGGRGNCGCGGGFNPFAGVGDFFSGLFDGESSLIDPNSRLGQIQQQFEMLRILSEASGMSPLQLILLQLQG
jgi:hypothetical protein